MLPDHRKILPVLLLNTTQASVLLEGGRTFQNDQSPSKLTTEAVVVPASAGWILLAKVPQKKNCTEFKRFTK